MEASSENIIRQASTFAERWMKRYDASHDFSHVQRVLHLSQHIAHSEQARTTQRYDLYIIQLVALLHDVGDRKYANPGDSRTPAYDFLISTGASEETSKSVQLIADCVSFSKEKNDPLLINSTLTRHPELAVVQDADRLDSLGAIGIGRCFTYGSSNSERKKQQQLNGGSLDVENTFSMDDALTHFDEKLIKLESMMKTQTGKQIARQRTERLTTFRDWWEEEWRCAM